MKNSTEQSAPSTAQASVELKISELKVKSNKIDLVRLKSEIGYCLISGRLFWLPKKNPTKRQSAWNKRFAYKYADKKINKRGYRVVKFSGKYCAAHRLAWALFSGLDPQFSEIDHKNCIKTDNRPENIRLATIFDNKRNFPVQKNNLSGFKGVTSRNNGKSFIARIFVYGKSIQLGRFKTAELASLAYAAASKKLHGEFGRS